MTIQIIPPSFPGDYWQVVRQYGFHSSLYAKCATRAEAKLKAQEARQC